MKTKNVKPRRNKPYTPRHVVNYFIRLNNSLSPMIEWLSEVVRTNESIVNRRGDYVIVIGGGYLKAWEGMETLTDIADHYHARGFKTVGTDAIERLKKFAKAGMPLPPADVQAALDQTLQLRDALLRTGAASIKRIIDDTHTRVLLQMVQDNKDKEAA
ncbi:hypothetical protein DTO96_102552 [Ephemeroptericola cinctiostellae]|uniref:Uncharacterized protein n=1 Tax=Ephemeroptericola cinctiostellae TaxID=2268024 RepID=A0A345DEK8_9BURK|nr:hypothetical protein [Ephemeroptericola cinctiostellae]AXF86796.1 hypothetical protein DTO96_102552 [Ephemeroptericola cinctiostellae]